MTNEPVMHHRDISPSGPIFKSLEAQTAWLKQKDIEYKERRRLSALRKAPKNAVEKLSSIVTQLDRVGVEQPQRVTRAPRKVLCNPLFHTDITHYEITQDVEDTIIGIIRAERAEYTGTHRGEVVDYHKMKKVFLHMETITVAGTMQYLNIGKHQAQRYVVMAEKIAPFLKNP